MLYVISFFVLLIAECMGILRDLFVMHNNRMMVSLLNAAATMLWCLKIVIVVDNPWTIITAGLGAFIGGYMAFWLHKLIDKKHAGSSS